MVAELGLYAELLLFLVGTFLYGFLTREILRNTAITAGNRPFMFLAGSLAIWYSGSLLDEVGTVLVGPTRWLPHVGPVLDVVRGLAFLLSFPLLAHALWWMLGGRAGDLRRRRPGWYWLIPGYVTFLLFMPTAYRVLEERWTLLSDVSRDVYPLFIFHATLCSLIAARMVLFALGASVGSDLVRFLRWLVGSLFAMVGLVVMGAFVIHIGAGSIWAELAWRLSAETAGLLLGLTFLYFIQRYNLFRMSLSLRSLRHFLSIMALVILVMLAGPAFGAKEDPDLFRRFIAWGVLIALMGGITYTPVKERLLRRYDWLRRWLGRALTEEEIDRLTERIHDPRLTEDEMMEFAARELGRLLAADARFLTDRSRDEALEPVWHHFSDPSRHAFNRLDAPTPETARALTESGLHGVFPLRVGDDLKAVLALKASTTGGGYREGEMEAIRLALRQLATSLEVRRLVEARLADERRRAEQERLGMLGLVSASLAHELKNPLSSMKALAQTVQEELVRERPSSEQSRDMALIVEQIDRLSGVAREILDFSRPKEAGDVDLASLVRSSCYVLDHEARRRGLALDVAGVQDVGRVPGTNAAWQTVVFNLILNGIQHAPAGSTVKLRLFRTAGQVCFETENAGPPIPPELCRHLFDAFVTDESEVNSGLGTGLGLALVDRRARELGGSVELVNESDHIVFRVRLGASEAATRERGSDTAAGIEEVEVDG